MKAKEQTMKPEVPKWFDGMIYNEGATVRNPYSGETCELNAVELSIYDFILGAQMYEQLLGSSTEFRKALDWFRKNNPSAYMILLD